MTHKKELVILCIVSLVSVILGIINVLNGNFSGHPYFLIPLGIFIWGDALIIGPFLFFISLYLLHKNKPIYTGLILSLFASVRSFIEIMYGLNAQFSPILRPWEAPYLNFKVFNLRIVELQMLYQVGFTCIFIICFIVFLNYLRKYFLLKR